MKKHIILAAIATAVITVTAIRTAETEIPEAKACATDIGMLPRKEYADAQLGFTALSGDVLNRNYVRMIVNYCKIPKGIRDRFQSEGWILSMTDEELEETWFKDWDINVCAGTDTSKKEIRCENSRSGADAVTHEIGHYLQTHLTEEEQSAWLAIYEEEKSCMTEYARTDLWEGFAECVHEAYTDPEAISDCPKAKSLIGSITLRIAGAR